MNKARRKELDRALAMIQEAREILDACGTEEQEYADNMHENLQGNEKHSKAEECASELDNISSDLEDIEARVQECME